MSRFLRIRSIALFLAIPAASAQSAPAVPRLTAAVRAAIIDSAVARLERTYVEADTARLIGQTLRAQLEAGGYTKADTPVQFAELVTFLDGCSKQRSGFGFVHTPEELPLLFSPCPAWGDLPTPVERENYTRVGS